VEQFCAVFCIVAHRCVRLVLLFSFHTVFHHCYTYVINPATHFDYLVHDKDIRAMIIYILRIAFYFLQLSVDIALKLIHWVWITDIICKSN